MKWWERIFVWVREKLGIDRQRPSPLKELNTLRT